MSEESSNNKRIAKNTLLLYFRMLLIMAVTLYTSRVILEALGVEDFGIYNVVGGVVSMLSMLTGSLSAAISRFFTIELGKGDQNQLKLVFSSSISIQILIVFVVIAIAETVGLWFLNFKMTIPETRLSSANLVYQLSLITFCINLISVPYNAAIIAHERMSAFAYIGIVEVIGKLIIAYVVSFSTVDRLVLYGILMCIEALVIRSFYSVFCRKNFDECTSIHFVFDLDLLKKMFGFAGWNFIGASSAILRSQGGNVLLNIFFGPAVNAARGISMQVNSAVNSFTRNFMVALDPQITKNYAIGNYSYMFDLSFQGSRFSFYMLLLLSMPILYNSDSILSLWLNDVPAHTNLFVQLILLFSLSECISNPLITIMLATGDIKKYQLVVGGMQMLNIPIGYFLLLYGYPPETIVVVAIILSQLCLVARMYMLKQMINFPVKKFISEVYLSLLFVLVLSSTIIFVFFYFFEGEFYFRSLISFLFTFVVILVLGLTSKERSLLGRYIFKFRYS